MTYDSYFIAFPKFIYLRVGGIEGEPLKLPKYSPDKYVLIKIYR